MAKDKKKAKKDKLPVSDDLLDVAAVSLKKYRKVTKQLGKLSTGQKIVGSIALLAAGLTYLAKQADGVASPCAPNDAATLPAAVEAAYAADDAETVPPAAAPRKSRKRTKAT
ncbi:hypothetical protein IC235_06455 [Hymenobacter sp. BT664]|uniref:Uncharacterized protein n=1 Tax=Hymenobacter montanus TaxID=2771359 RepID=A0A927GIN3_9BACT|nr:hypothetical protein [Hymenobacter montanus]MBD2767530.1 hypothetical protein [Hymenobacter montanus]